LRKPNSSKVYGFFNATHEHVYTSKEKEKENRIAPARKVLDLIMFICHTDEVPQGSRRAQDSSTFEATAPPRRGDLAMYSNKLKEKQL
jgi:hypothetical protein